jgi:hypothetical protein
VSFGAVLVLLVIRRDDLEGYQVDLMLVDQRLCIPTAALPEYLLQSPHNRSLMFQQVVGHGRYDLISIVASDTVVKDLMVWTSEDSRTCPEA